MLTANALLTIVYSSWWCKHLIREWIIWFCVLKVLHTWAMMVRKGRWLEQGQFAPSYCYTAHTATLLILLHTHTATATPASYCRRVLAAAAFLLAATWGNQLSYGTPPFSCIFRQILAIMLAGPFWTMRGGIYEILLFISTCSWFHISPLDATFMAKKSLNQVSQY